MSEYIDFESEIPWKKMEVLLDLGNEYDFDPSSDIESENYFMELVSKYEFEEDNFMELLRRDIEREFRVIDKRPEWLQNPEWQFNNGKPMEFIGQIDIERNSIGLNSDATFYIFWDRETGETKMIMQMV
ncbi:MAG: hypothetical protein K2N34_06640 [Lachnospiraceae bacterium]|nr:hypothetical protein [Lachnospiraceae bacterium]